MEVTNDIGDILNDYYDTNPGVGSAARNHPNPVLPCNNSTDFKLWSLPYDLQEMIYWVIKMLVLPILVSILTLFENILPTFENPVFGIINSFLEPIAGIFILIMGIETARAIRYRIPQNNRVASGESLNTLEDDTSIKIGFVGDIMMMNGHNLNFDPSVVDFFKDVKVIVGNLEGIVTDAKKHLFQQRHLIDIPLQSNDPSQTIDTSQCNILSQLTNLLSPNINWLLTLSNNHSIDYGNNAFHDSLIAIQSEPRINVFGRNDVKNVLVQGFPINIASGTELSNQNTFTCTSRYRNAELWEYHKNDNNPNGVYRFNILFPHWGYENERYIRKRIQKDATALLTSRQQTYSNYQNYIRRSHDKLILPSLDPFRKWDLIFGHHSHTPQPIMKVDDILTDQSGTKIQDQSGNDIIFQKLVAFSGGNLTSGAWIIRRKKHIYGTVMRCDIGTLKGHPNQLAVGKVEWRTTVNRRGHDHQGKYKTVEFYRRRYRTFAHYLWSLLFGFGIIALILILRYIDSIL